MLGCWKEHQESLSGDGDTGVLSSSLAKLHAVGILYFDDTVTRRQKSLSGNGDMGVFSSFLANLHYVRIMYFGDLKQLNSIH